MRRRKGETGEQRVMEGEGKKGGWRRVSERVKEEGVKERGGWGKRRVGERERVRQVNRE